MSDHIQNPFSNEKLSFSRSASTSSTIETTACGKAIITGEHSAVYGAHAVAIPLPEMRFRFRMTQKSMRLGSQPEIQLKLAGHEGSPRLKSVVLRAMELLKIEPFSLDAETHSTLPIGAGLGSSATLCVAVLRALALAHDKLLLPSELAEYANELEKSFHGNPSGLDTAVVAFEQPVLFAKGKAIQALKLAPEFEAEFVLIDSNVRASTLAMIRIAEPYFKSEEGDVRLRRFDQISLDTFEALTKGSIPKLAHAMNECGQLLSEAGVVPSNIQAMIDHCRSLGAIASKSTGAGGGGVIMALLPNDRGERQRVFERMQEEFQGHGVYRISLS